MSKIAFAFLAGSLLTCAGIITADYRTGVMFIAGGVCLLIAQLALISNVKRAQRFARFLLAVCDSYRKPLDQPLSRTASAALVPDPRIEDLTSALRNFGMPKGKAAQVAADAAKAGGTFAEMISRATAAARVN